MFRAVERMTVSVMLALDELREGSMLLMLELHRMFGHRQSGLM